MSSLFVHAVDNRNKNMASINKTMWNYNSMVDQGCLITVQLYFKISA